MASLLDNIRDGLELVVDKTEEYGKIGKLKVDIFSIKRNIEKQFTELGGRVYELTTGTSKTKVENDDESKKIIEQIKVLETQLKDKEAEVEKVKEEKEKERQERQESRKKEHVDVEDDTSEDINPSNVEDAKVVEEKDKDKKE